MNSSLARCAKTLEDEFNKLEGVTCNKAVENTAADLYSVKFINGRSKGFGFVQISSEESTTTALATWHDTMLEGGKLYVSKYVKKNEMAAITEEEKFTNLYVKILMDIMEGCNVVIMKDNKAKIPSLLEITVLKEFEDEIFDKLKSATKEVIDGEEAYQTFQSVIENAKVTMATYENLILSDVRVYPEKGTFTLFVGLHGWAFTLTNLAVMYWPMLQRFNVIMKSARGVQEGLQNYKNLQDIIAVLGMEELIENGKLIVYGGEARISTLRQMFPLMKDKKSLALMKKAYQYIRNMSLKPNTIN
ncbi:hypothetical protein REPUB_Repub02eG0210100 [Reevesia pubescens]